MYNYISPPVDRNVHDLTHISQRSRPTSLPSHETAQHFERRPPVSSAGTTAHTYTQARRSATTSSTGWTVRVTCADPPRCHIFACERAKRPYIFPAERMSTYMSHLPRINHTQSIDCQSDAAAARPRRSTHARYDAAPQPASVNAEAVVAS